MPEIHLRNATLDDLPLLRRWDEQPHVQVSDPNDDWDWETELPLDQPWQRQFVAEAGGRPVGFLQVLDPQHDPNRYWGDDVPPGTRAIDIWIGEPDALNRGYGTEMMRQALAMCFAAPDVHTVLIDPLAANTAAIRFYQRLGFRLLGHRWFGPDYCAVHQLTRSDWAARNPAAPAASTV